MEPDMTLLMPSLDVCFNFCRKFLLLVAYDFSSKCQTFVSEKEHCTIEWKNIGNNDFK